MFIYAAIHLYVFKISAYSLPWGQTCRVYRSGDVVEMPQRHITVYNWDIIAFNWKTFIRCKRENKFHNLYVPMCANSAEILMLSHYWHTPRRMWPVKLFLLHFAALVCCWAWHVAELSVFALTFSQHNFSTGLNTVYCLTIFFCCQCPVTVWRILQGMSHYLRTTWLLSALCSWTELSVMWLHQLETQQRQLLELFLGTNEEEKKINMWGKKL